jgi:hypothetical protein
MQNSTQIVCCCFPLSSLCIWKFLVLFCFVCESCFVLLVTHRHKEKERSSVLIDGLHLQKKSVWLSFRVVGSYRTTTDGHCVALPLILLSKVSDRLGFMTSHFSPSYFPTEEKQEEQNRKRRSHRKLKKRADQGERKCGVLKEKKVHTCMQTRTFGRHEGDSRLTVQGGFSPVHRHLVRIVTAISCKRLNRWRFPLRSLNTTSLTASNRRRVREPLPPRGVALMPQCRVVFLNASSKILH